MTARFGKGAFVQAGINAQKRIFDQCNLVDAGIMAAVVTRKRRPEVAEIFPGGRKACHQDLPYRPDFKLLGSYPLPLDILISGTFQFTRGVQNGARWQQHPRDVGGAPATATTIGRRVLAPNAADARSSNLIAVGENYGNDDLKQLDLRVSKRFKLDQLPLPRRLRCLQPVQQQLAVLGQQHVLDRGDQPLAEADERAAVAVLQDRRAVRLLVVTDDVRSKRLNAEKRSNGELNSPFLRSPCIRVDRSCRGGRPGSRPFPPSKLSSVLSSCSRRIVRAGCRRPFARRHAATLDTLAKRPVPLRSGIGVAHDGRDGSKQAQAFYDQGLAYLHSYVWLEAARSFNQALRLDPTLALAHAGLAVAYAELNAPAAATAALERAKALARTTTITRHVDARALQMAQKAEVA